MNLVKQKKYYLLVTTALQQCYVLQSHIQSSKMCSFNIDFKPIYYTSEHINRQTMRKQGVSLQSPYIQTFLTQIYITLNGGRQ